MSQDNVKKNILPVKIAGETVTVFSDDDPEYILRMADYINYIIDEFNAKKGYSVRQNLLLVYAALELCNSLFKEQEIKVSAAERNYEKQYQMEIFNHKKTQSLLSVTQKRLDETEKQLKSARSELEEFIKAFDTQEREAE